MMYLHCTPTLQHAGVGSSLKLADLMHRHPIWRGKPGTDIDLQAYQAGDPEVMGHPGQS